MAGVIPINYELMFEPLFHNFKFNGEEIITINLSKPTNSIKIDAAELSIKESHIIQGGKIISSESSLNEKDEKLTIKLAKKIKGKAKLSIKFTGTLNDRLLGFYKSQYKDKKGKTKYLATTQFEAADARRAFPCWDEPAVKATFDVSLLVDKHLDAISNMPVISKKKTGTKILHKFGRTPIMSTYLLYLGVGEFEYLHGKLRNIKIRIVTTKGNKNKGKLSLDFTKKFLGEYEKYFGIRYPLPKLDMIAIPDFAAGAMENWGAITFREAILLFDTKTSSTRTKQYIAEVISHELAHQWFGNLVTMKWWNDLWLNESFATFMATKIVNKFYPEWDLWDQFLGDAMLEAMSLDALKNSHPINVDVKHPAQIREIFDAISYDKGGNVLRMLENYVGIENFRKGLKYYLTQHRYSNAEGQDLWKSIGKVAHKPVDAMMKTWIDQVGYPVVDVKRNNSKVSLTQRRFLSDGSISSKNRWSIPIHIEEGNHESSILMKSQKSVVSLKNTDSNFIINSGRYGFYRVQYDDNSLANLSLLIDEKILNHVDRWSLQNDLFSQCVSGTKQIQEYLDFTTSYHDEDNYITLQNLAQNLYHLYKLTRKEKFSDEIRTYTAQFLGTIFDRLGWDSQKNEKHTDALLRSFVITALGKLGDKEILNEARKRFNKFLKNKNSLTADLQEPVFVLVAWQGNEKTYNKLLSLYKKSTLQEEKIRFLMAMCNFKQKNLLLKTLALSLTPEVRSQNIRVPIMGISANIYGSDILWPWLKNNWKKLVRRFGVGNPLANRIVASIGGVIDDKQEKDVRKFFKRMPLPGTERVIEQTLERVRIRSKFLRSIRAEFV
uniref:Aminopeptidase n=1 Tax=uncultured marine thaumarchaeote SAT1000_39_F02 TaxID=1456407 RepID=A0A075IA06_9ARCH|nr:peptidase M1 membrane alanine aminopeptidase (trf2/trf3) [uncultured marine thaumarchaeote SAT1000_39_F02]